jgi:hypothetical protein
MICAKISVKLRKNVQANLSMTMTSLKLTLEQLKNAHSHLSETKPKPKPILEANQSIGNLNHLKRQ